MNYPSNLSDSQWQAIKLLLPPKIWQRKRKQSVRAIINGILYVVKGGISWRMMPSGLPDWRLVYWYASPALFPPVGQAGVSPGNS